MFPKRARTASEDAPANDAHCAAPADPRREHVLTVKVLGVFGLLGAALWAANLWTAAR